MNNIFYLIKHKVPLEYLDLMESEAEVNELIVFLEEEEVMKAELNRVAMQLAIANVISGSNTSIKDLFDESKQEKTPEMTEEEQQELFEKARMLYKQI